MPVLQINTNVPNSKIPDDFNVTTTAALAKTLGAEEKWIMIQVTSDQRMTLGNSSDPCAYCVIRSIGRLGPVENRAHSKALAEHIEKHLGVPINRIYMTFCDTVRTDAFAGILL